MIRVSHEIGQNIAIHRRRAGISQTRLAEMISEATGDAVSLSMVSSWERGLTEIPASLVPDVCRILHCTSFDLYPHSSILSDDDVQLIATVTALDENEKAELMYLLRDWDGDKRALLKLVVLHAAQARELRYGQDMAIIKSYVYAMANGGDGIDLRAPVDIDYVRRAHRRLLDD